MENILKSSIDYTIANNNKSSLEYYDNYKMKKEKHNLINTMLQSDNQYDVEFAMVYEIDDHYTSKRISSSQALNAYNEIKTTNRDVEISINLFKSYLYLDEQAFGLLDEQLMGLQYAIDSIQDEYISGMYEVRYSVLSVISLVAKNYIKEAREVCETLMNDNLDNYYSALIALHYGNTFMQDDPTKAIEIYEKGLALATGKRCDTIRDNLRNSYDFVSIMMGTFPKYLNFNSIDPSEKHNVAFWYIRSNNISTGEELLNTLDFDSLNDVQKAFHHFYRGFINEPMKHFSQSLKHFKLGGEYYFRKLALYELEKLGLDRNVIEALSV